MASYGPLMDDATTGPSTNDQSTTDPGTIDPGTTDPGTTDPGTTDPAAPPWTTRLLDQLEWHWRVQLRPGLEGLTDREHLWEPVPGCWSLRPRGEAVTPMAAGGGDVVADFAFPEPEPAPVTTIAWRLGHLIVGVLGARNASHFGGPAMSYQTYDWSLEADVALGALDEAADRWFAGVAELGAEGLERSIGPAEGPWAEHTYAKLVLHIHREVIHHGAEVLLLRDLHRHLG